MKPHKIIHRFLNRNLEGLKEVEWYIQSSEREKRKANQEYFNLTKLLKMKEKVRLPDKQKL